VAGQCHLKITKILRQYANHPHRFHHLPQQPHSRVPIADPVHKMTGGTVPIVVVKLISGDSNGRVTNEIPM
jgi:hypothetical protein